MSADTTPNSDNDRPGLPREVRRRVLLSWASLAAERVYPILWPAGGVVGAFVILALANTFTYFPEWLHLISLMGFFAAIVWSVMWSLRQSSIPTHAQAVRHLEQSSGLDHRPLSSMEDHPASLGDNDTKQLWRAHQRWIYAHLNRLTVAWPKLSLTAKDPHALRVLMGLAIVALVIANWSEVPSRLSAALSPGLAQGHAPATFEAWVTPPTYTGEAPRHLTAQTSVSDATLIAVPAGSVLTVRTHGASSAVMRAASFGGLVPRQARPEFLPAGGDARDAKLVVDSDVTVKLSLNATQSGHWRFKIKNDTPPKIQFKQPLAVTQAQSLRFSYEVEDDFGVTSAEGSIALDSGNKAETSLPPIRFELPLPPSPARKGEVMIFKDLTDHIWAGLKVKVVLTAKDELGQTAHSKVATIILPERRFTNPLARALVEQRRNLARDPRSSAQVAKALDALSIAPERFMPDTRVYLALRTATFEAHRARLDDTHVDTSRIISAQQLLWDLALRVEEGDTPQAQAELRDIQRKLMDALAKGGSEEEIERLMAQMRAALERALKAIAERSQGANQMMQGLNGQVVRPQDLKSMMDKIQELARQGSKSAAQQMLSQMLELMENVQSAGGGKMSPEQQAATQALEQLSTIMARQRGLMDQTFREQKATENSANKKPSTLQGTQEKLGNDLTPIIKQMMRNPESAGALKRAQDAMDNAADQLGSGDLGPAGQSQQKAIDEMRKGGQALAQQLLQQMAGQGAPVPGSAGAGSGDNEDPFGRPQSSSGPTFGDSVKVPDKLDIQRAREILEELQKRAAERERPETELEYIERLLRRF
ncbi:MAG: TIGR02302 family protein [Micropepsaceae bacterium]